MEFDASGALKKFIFIQIFQDWFKPLIAAQMEQCGREKDTWEELVEKAIEAEAKVSLLLSLFIQDIDQRYLQGNRPTTLTKSQTSSTRDPQEKPSKKAQNPEPSHSPRLENSETFNPKAREEKKKKNRRKQARKNSGSTLATTVNFTEAIRGARKVMSEISC